MQEGDFYLPAAVMGVALIVKFPAFLRGWRNPTVRAVNAMLLLPCVGFVFSSPTTVTAVNRLSGISNVSALLVHSILTAYACATLVLLALWSGEPAEAERTRRRVRTWKILCGLVIAGLTVLFSLGEAPLERTKDFDTYYADTPFIREMVLLYLLWYLVAAVVTAVVCWNWLVGIGRRTAPDGHRTTADASLRIGLLVLVVAAMANIVFGSCRLATIAARWAGRDWNAVNPYLSQFISASGVMIGVGLLIPAYGPGLVTRVLHPLKALLALRPLWRLARCPGPPGTAPRGELFPPPPWYAGPEQVLLYRMTTIHDWMWGLRTHCCEDRRERAYRDSRAAGAGEREAAAVGLAVMLRVAAADRAEGRPTAGAGGAPAVAAIRAAGAGDRDLLVSVSRALAAARP
ncbi:DUF6545 domain-containing protein [Streptomyces sp. NPDC097619]|uniref:DUF6545 domain-containing protein n=1 Tax=Streptomyces sp. NPDC097619 TaxID=3157228 RepID=UPI00331D6AC2